MHLAACVLSVLASGAIDWDPRRGAPRPPVCGLCDAATRREVLRAIERDEELLRRLAWLVDDPGAPLDARGRRPFVGRIRRRAGLEE